MKRLQLDTNLKINLIANLLDGSFFGLAVGMASFVTIIPLFVSTLTDSAILIGLAPAMHSVGWYLPQLLVANRVARQERFKPMVMWMTIHERIPFLGLALVAWMLPHLDNTNAIIIVFLMLIWQGFGGGFAANPWQNMIGKIFPDRLHGTFFGAQSALSSAFGMGGAVFTGYLLDRYEAPYSFAAVFLFAAVSLGISMGALAFTREEPQPVSSVAQDRGHFLQELSAILKTDTPFLKFLGARSFSQIGIMMFGFYTVFITREFGVSGQTIGFMTAVLSLSRIFGNIILGQVGDRVGHRFVMQFGAVALILSALTAWFAPSYEWFYLAFAIGGICYVSAWTTPMAMTLQFGRKEQRPAYVGLSNTVTAPSALLAPVLGGLLADAFGYQATFLVAALCGVLMLLVLRSMSGWRPDQAQAEPSA